MDDDESMTKGYLYQGVEVDYLLKKECHNELYYFDTAGIK